MNLTSNELLRLLLAIGAVSAYGLMCLLIARRETAKRRVETQFAGDAHAAPPAWRIAYASQTGTAEEIARLTADTFRLAGVRVLLTAMSALDDAALVSSERILFIVSTYGEGDPPDNAALFAQRQMSRILPLGHLHYAALILGDRSYTHFCGFGQQLNSWLNAQGARALFPFIEVDRCDSASMNAWYQQLSHLAGTDDAPDWQGPTFTAWRLAARAHLNPGSQGNDIFHLEFEPAGETSLPDWESGDLAQIQAPTDVHPREYSIASIPRDGRVHLLVRLHRHMDGTYGAASGWLTQALHVGDNVPLRIRQHERFRLGENAARPLILIGNGSGISGLRGHLKARVEAKSGPNWLLFGERNSACDFHYRAELETWLENGALDKLDVVFSRDKPERRYVQDRILEASCALQDWINQGAAIYVCGSLKGMAGGVDDALAAILSRSTLDELSSTGRYRRDVY
ncbi:MAG: oxidoreductase [Verrucomicrobiaceae bacterium]|nr:oxidoreductase [Verrucomicrobiaceae bacterium]